MEIKRLDHHRIVAGAIKELGLAEKIDRAIPKTRAHRVSVGEAVKAMILIGLGYTSSRGGADPLVIGRESAAMSMQRYNTKTLRISSVPVLFTPMGPLQNAPLCFFWGNNSL